MRIVRVILVLGAILHLSGGHYGVLQCIAWANMLVSYSAEGGLMEGARMTFDGEHPCGMCKAISAAKEHDRQDGEKAPPTGVDKLSLKDLKLTERISLDALRPDDFKHPGFSRPTGLSTQTSNAPPSPPPRRV
ncbi:hypothetical protein [Haloferula helveola]|uniref:hypothetical protein n=1 Tax=Haloferula helveola TaxID=490095 RepID=UPI003097CA8F